MSLVSKVLTLKGGEGISSLFFSLFFFTVDKLEEMIGSYGPRPEPYTKRFASEEAPSGMLARSGSNTVRSRVIDDDGTVYADWWVSKVKMMLTCLLF